MSDLSLVTLDELVEELEKRVDHCIVIARRMTDVEDRRFAYRRWHKGEVEDVMYLLHHCKFWLHTEIMETDREAEPWEEL